MSDTAVVSEPSNTGSSSGGPGGRKAYAKSHRLQVTLIGALVMWLIGGLIANTAQTAGGHIKTQDVHFYTATGNEMYGLLYIPDSATAKTPSCGVVATHGYINSHDTMDSVAIEMARRGCVVLADDQTGHGYSGGPAFADAFGGAAALTYMQTLPMVNKTAISLVGHSMGGWSSVLAAAAVPTGYQSVVLMSSSVSTPGVEPIPGTPQFPKNTAVVEAKYSEFSGLMWAVPNGGEFVNSKRMQTFFGTDSKIVPGQIYGSIADGTAKALYLENTTHPGVTQWPHAVKDTVSWLQKTLPGVHQTAPTNQIWYWDDIGVFIMLIGALLTIYATGGLLAKLPVFAGLQRTTEPEFIGLKGFGWWLGLAISAAVAGFSFYWLMNQGASWFKASQAFPQTVTTGIAVWALFGAIISIILFTIWHKVVNKNATNALASYGVGDESGKFTWKPVGLGLALAIASLVPFYVLLSLSQWAWHTDVRVWIYNFKPVDYQHAKIFLDYIIPITLYFVVLSLVMHSQFFKRGGSLGWTLVRNMFVTTITYIVFVAIEYLTLWITGELATSSQALFTIVLIQFIPVFLIAGSLITWFNRKTGWIWPGAFVCAILITAQMVAGTASQALPW